MNEKEADEALESLIAEGLVERTEDGQFRRTGKPGPWEQVDEEAQEHFVAFVSEQTGAGREDILHAEVEARTDKATGYFEILVTGRIAGARLPS